VTLPLAYAVVLPPAKPPRDYLNGALGLSHNQTQRQIADDEGVSVRTIEGRIAGLKEKLDVPTTFMLGVMAERLGFVP